MSIILHYCCSLVWNMDLFTSAQLFNAGRNSKQTHSQFLVYRKKSLTFLIFDVGQCRNDRRVSWAFQWFMYHPLGFFIFRDSKAGMVPSTLGMCRYISHSEIVCRGPKKFENPCSTVCCTLKMEAAGSSETLVPDYTASYQKDIPSVSLVLHFFAFFLISSFCYYQFSSDVLFHPFVLYFLVLQ